MVNFNPIDWYYIVSCQFDLENTKESIHPVCDQPYHKIKEKMPLGEELENLWNYPLHVTKRGIGQCHIEIQRTSQKSVIWTFI